MPHMLFWIAGSNMGVCMPVAMSSVIDMDQPRGGRRKCSFALERVIAQGLALIERRNSLEFLRDAAAELYAVLTGQAWRPRPARWSTTQR